MKITNLPKIAIIANSIGVFSPDGKQQAETQMRAYFELLKKENKISGDSIFYEKRIYSPFEAQEALDIFIREKIDGLILLNSAFPNGNTFLAFAANPYLWNTPLIVTSPPEIDLGTNEWTTNAYCGLIMNNYTAKRIGRHIYTLSGWPNEKKYQDEFARILRVVNTIKQLRQEVIGKLGDAPAGFHSANGDMLAYAKTFGIRVETIDLLHLADVYESGSAEGMLTKSSFDDKNVEKTYNNILKGKELLTDSESVKRAARLYHSIKAVAEANGFSAISLRCWPEIMQKFKVSACLVIGQLMSDGVLNAVACEGDWPNVVSQVICAHLSQAPSPCLDFVNDISGKAVIQTGHCGVGIASMMENVQISEISPDRQAGVKIGPTCIGQFRYGKKTGVCLIRDEKAAFKLLAFGGESSAKTEQKLRYSAADIKINNPEKLNELIIKHGFTHHLAIAFGDIMSELKMFCDFYGVDFISPE